MFQNMNPYTLRTQEVEGIVRYFVAFKDGQGLLREIEVSRPIYLEFQRFAKQEHNQDRQDRRHMERSDLTDQSLYDRALHKPKSVEDTVLDNMRAERLAEVIAELPEIQRRRFVLYHEFGLTYDQIAKMEGCKRQPIIRSVSRAEEKIRESFKE